MKRLLLLILFWGFSFAGSAQGYLMHLTVDKIYVNGDSVVFRKGKTFVREIKGQSDTLEVGAVKSVPVAIVVRVDKKLVAKKTEYSITYTFFKKESGQWTKVKSFSGSSRYDLLKADHGAETSLLKKNAREEYACSFGYPVTAFAAKFRLDVYRK